MSDTPETDRWYGDDSSEFEAFEYMPCYIYFEMKKLARNFARRLERERNEATKTALMWKANHDNQVELKSIISKRGDLRDRAPKVEKLIAERDQLRDAVKWALGESGDFGSRPKAVGAYWWREELRKRAGISEPNKTTKNE